MPYDRFAMPDFLRAARRMCRCGFLCFSCICICSFLLLTGCQSLSTPDVFVPDPERDYSLGMLHHIVPDDSLAEVARFYQRDETLIAKLNHLNPPFKLTAGDFLFIPPENNDAILRKISPAYIEKIRNQHVAWDSGEIPDQAPAPKKPTLMKALFSFGSGSSRKSEEKEYKFKGEGRVIPVMPPNSKRNGFIWPVAGRLGRGFSADPDKPHKGVDIASPEGMVIHAARSGRVLYAGKLGSYGLIVVLDHSDGFATLYAHTSKLLVTKGQTVAQAQPIAEVGSTGRSTGPHLHFEVRYNGAAINPEKYLPMVP